MSDNFTNLNNAVTLQDILSLKEERSEKQKELLLKFSSPVVCFSLNIVSNIKVFAQSVRTFNEGVNLFKYRCIASDIKILHLETVENNAGFTGYFIIDATAIQIKKITCNIELNSSIGRLFDFDVIDVDGRKLTRTELGYPERKCLICDENAFLCSRAQKHSTADVFNKSIAIMNSYFNEMFSEKVAKIAVRAVLQELYTTPKPGLVDKLNNGSHSDMDLSIFENSALSLFGYFNRCCHKGICSSPDKLGSILEILKPLGIQAEIDMRRTTFGVNTHKGAIFSLGIACCAIGYIYKNNLAYSISDVQDICKKISAPIINEFMKIDKKITHGQDAYLSSGIKGARGEAITGFANVFQTGLPVFNKYILKGYSQNDAGVITLLHLISKAEDTNIISRSSIEELANIQKHLADFLTSGDNCYLEYAQKLDHYMISRNITPGGSADLLAMVYFFYHCGKELKEIILNEKQGYEYGF